MLAFYTDELYLIIINPKLVCHGDCAVYDRPSFFQVQDQKVRYVTNLQKPLDTKVKSLALGLMDRGLDPLPTIMATVLIELSSALLKHHARSVSYQSCRH